IPECGHMSPMEQPRLVAALIAQCLAAAEEAAATSNTPQGATSTDGTLMGSVQAPAFQHIAFIGYGEAGSCLGSALAARGVTIQAYDTLCGSAEGRARLESRAATAGVTLCSSLKEALAGAELVISAVTAASAAEAAQQAAE